MHENHADLLPIKGVIDTLDPTTPRTQALAVHNGTVLALDAEGAGAVTGMLVLALVGVLASRGFVMAAHPKTRT
jgi:predicted amidohydrolase YtcJ